MNIEEKSVQELKWYKQNNKTHPAKQVDMIANSIKQFWFKNPIIIDKNNEIIAWHGRLLGAKQLWMETVPCIIADDLTEEQVRAYRLLDNKIWDFGEYDMENIIAELWDIGDYQLGLESLDSIFKDLVPEDNKEIEEDDYEIPEEVKTDIVLWDLFQIGNHRLLCWDSTKKEDVSKLMNGEKADMVFTDPPYGMNLDTDYSKMPSTKKEGNKNYNKIKGDNEDFTDELINTIFACFNDCKEIFIWGADYFAELLPNKNQGSWIVWDKRVEEKFDKMIGSAFELCWSKSKHQRQIARFNNTLFSGEQDARNKVHPTQKPIKLACWFLEQWSAKENLIADLFLGSGSTMVASHQLKRKCYGMELDPKYCQVIIDRMIKLDPTLEIKKNWLPYNPINNG